LCPSRAQGKHTAIARAVVPQSGNGNIVERFGRTQLVNPGNGIVYGEVFGPTVNVLDFLSHITGFAYGIMIIAVKATVAQVSIGDIIQVLSCHTHAAQGA